MSEEAGEYKRMGSRRGKTSSEPQEWTTDSIVSAMLEEQKSNPAWSKAELWGIERDIVPLLRSRISTALAAAERSRSDWSRAAIDAEQQLAAEQTVSKRLVEALEIAIQLIEALGIKPERAEWSKTALALTKDHDRVVTLVYRFHAALTAISAQLKRRLNV